MKVLILCDRERLSYNGLNLASKLETDIQKFGAGGFLISQRDNMAKNGPALDVYKALYELCKSIENNAREKENVFVTPKMPVLCINSVVI